MHSIGKSPERTTDESEQGVDPHPPRRRADRHRHVDWGPILAITVACALYASAAHWAGWL